MPKKTSSRTTQKDKIIEERRKDKRYKCLLPAHVIEAEGKERFVQRTTVHDFSRGGLKLVVNIVTLDPGSDVGLEVYVPEKGLKTLVNAQIAWKKMTEDKLEIGLKIKDMKKADKKELLKWIAPVGEETKKRLTKIAKKK